MRLLALATRYRSKAPRAIALRIEVGKAADAADTVWPRLAEGTIALHEQGDQMLVGNIQT